jgi:hypothetical protein
MESRGTTRIATVTRDGIYAPSLPTMRKIAPPQAATEAPLPLIDVLCLNYGVWDSYATHGLESPANRFHAWEIGKGNAQPPRKHGAPSPRPA